MIVKLKTLWNELDDLPESFQEKIAELIEDDIHWQKQFEASKEKLKRLANEAKQDYHNGKTFEMPL